MAATISIVICCYNSEARLLPTLEHLALQQAIQPEEWEIILVDNNSGDNTAQFARQTWLSLGERVCLRVVSEAQPGLLYARLKGVREAQAELIAFVDDDNWLEPEWLRQAIDIMRGHPEVGALGGSIEAVYQTPSPDWINSMEDMLACGRVDESYEHIFARGGLIAGAGCVIRKSCYTQVLEKFGPFEMAGRTGAALSGGDDIELLYKIQLLGFKVMKSGKLTLKHFIPAGRTTLPYFIKLASEFERGAMRLDPLRRVVSGQSHPTFWYYRWLAGFWVRLASSSLMAVVGGRRSSRPYVAFQAKKSVLLQTFAAKFTYEQAVAHLHDICKPNSSGN